jgi:tRNA nucleotidyltransferase/poly(A) polymerase
LFESDVIYFHRIKKNVKSQFRHHDKHSKSETSQTRRSEMKTNSSDFVTIRISVKNLVDQLRYKEEEEEEEKEKERRSRDKLPQYKQSAILREARKCENCTIRVKCRQFHENLNLNLNLNLNSNHNQNENEKIVKNNQIPWKISLSINFDSNSHNLFLTSMSFHCPATFITIKQTDNHLFINDTPAVNPFFTISRETVRS